MTPTTMWILHRHIFWHSILSFVIVIIIIIVINIISLQNDTRGTYHFIGLVDLGKDKSKPSIEIPNAVGDISTTSNTPTLEYWSIFPIPQLKVQNDYGKVW